MTKPLLIRKVQGHSMLPVFTPGKIVYATGWKTPKRHDVVIARHNGREIIKRVTNIKDQQFTLQGDNQADSTDAIVDQSDIVGVVL